MQIKALISAVCALTVLPATATPVCNGTGIQTSIGFDAKENDPCISAWAKCKLDPKSAQVWMIPASEIKYMTTFNKDSSNYKRAADSLLEFVSSKEFKTRASDLQLCEPRKYGTIITIGSPSLKNIDCTLRGSDSLDFTAKFTNPKGRKVINFSMMSDLHFKYLEADGIPRDFSVPFALGSASSIRIDIKSCKQDGYLPTAVTSYLYYPQIEERALGPVPFGLLVITKQSVIPAKGFKPKQEFKGL